MKRILRFTTGIIEYELKALVCLLFPELEEKFIRRKDYSEFYYEETEVILCIKDISMLSDKYVLTISFNDITIEGR